MKNMAETHHLQLRGGTWYYHRRVPQHLIARIGKKIVKFSLGTSDRAEAKRLRAIHDVATDAEFAQIETAAQPAKSRFRKPKAANKEGQRVPLEVLTEYLREAVAAEDDGSSSSYASDPPSSLDELSEMRIDAEQFLQTLTDPNDDRRDQQLFSFGRKVLSEAGVEPATEADWTAFKELARRGLVEIYRRKVARYSDQYDKSYFDVAFDPAKPKPVRIRALADAFLKEKEQEYEINGVAKKRRDKVVAHVETLVEILGADLLVRQVDDEAVQKVRSILARLPKNRKKFFPGLPLEKTLDRVKGDGRPGLSATTQGFYLETLRGLLNLAVRRKLLPDNPATGVQPLKKRTLKPDELRNPFTPDQLKAFFTSAFYQSCSPGAAQPYSKPDRDWRFWLPLIMLFSGARPNEIAQLRAADVKQTAAGHWYLNLDTSGEEGSNKQLKTQSSRRRIPLHSELRKLGFLAFVEQRRKLDSDQAELFPTLKPDKYGNRAWYALKRLNERFLPAAIELSDRQSLYSLRHNVRDALRRVDAPPGALQAVAGWSPGGKQVSDHYGDPGNPDFYVEWVDRISYDGLDLSFLHI
ncbi:MAG: DUF6538 domain-containing protein [Sphingomicrobium sp.]